MKNKSIMILGTASDVGKSILCTGLCRIFKQDGYKVSPFKAQNMALNSYITVDGKEIGRSQGIQAEAAGVEANVKMNPILLKPTGEMKSQVVLLGKPLQKMHAKDYQAKFLDDTRDIVQNAIDELMEDNDIMVMEGAGSPVEINLKDRDIVNMKAAEMANAPVILVADIDRGGVFASIVGTIELLSANERERVKGIIINKFRGDISLLQPGIEWLESRICKPVLGVVPFLKELDIDAEDSVVLEKTPHGYGAFANVQIAVIHLPLISNFSDIDSLLHEPDCNIYFVSNVKQFGTPDIVIIPGSKNTLADMRYLVQSMLAERIKAFAADGGIVIGVCGGYQMLGKTLEDDMQIESSISKIEGLNLLPVTTKIHREKVTTRSVAKLRPDVLPYIDSEIIVKGYEIHMGVSRVHSSNALLSVVSRSCDKVCEQDGAASQDGKVWGTYFHGIFDNGVLRRALINYVREGKGLGKLGEPIYDRVVAREKAFDRLATHLRKHLNIDKIYEIIGL